MYPKNGAQAVDLTGFPNCRAVLDIVYNPARTALLLQAEELGIKHAGGLHMLVAQAKRSSELFTGARIDDNEIGRIERALMHRMMNIVLVGMPGCGKTTVAGIIGRMTCRPVQDVDTMIEQRAGITIPEIFAQSGEEGFRKVETQIITEAGAQSGTAIATGGGSVTRQENYAPLHQNAVIVWLQRDIDKLPRDGRPLSARADLNEMYRRRAPMYSAFADMTADNNGTPEAAALYRHNEQSVRVVERIENGGAGLNLTYEVRMGILGHTGSFIPETLEGQIVRTSDRIAYINHDIDDAMRAGLLTEADIPRDITDILGHAHSERINTLVMNMIENTEQTGVLGMQPEVSAAMDRLRTFMFARVYTNSKAKGEESKAKDIIRRLYDYYSKNPLKLPADFIPQLDFDGMDRIVCDYIAGMTDRYAVYKYSELFIPTTWQMR